MGGLLAYKDFEVNFDGFWLDDNPPLSHTGYVLGSRVTLKDQDGDRLCYMDFAESICLICNRSVGDNKCSIRFLLNGKLCPISNDKELMYMWGKIDFGVDDKYHLFVDFIEIRTECSRAGPPCAFTCDVGTPSVNVQKRVPIESTAESPFKGKKTHLALNEIDPEEGYHSCHSSDSDEELLFTQQGGYFDIDGEESIDG